MLDLNLSKKHIFQKKLKRLTQRQSFFYSKNYLLISFSAFNKTIAIML
jgi:hypothetical protein